MLVLNIRSIQRNFDVLLVALGKIDTLFDIILLTECWIHESSLIPQLTGYNYFKTNKIINQNSGVVAYVRDVWNPVVSEP